jgi:hypothetical protein
LKKHKDEIINNNNPGKVIIYILLEIGEIISLIRAETL